MNKVILIGRISSGIYVSPPYAAFTIAVNETYDTGNKRIFIPVITKGNIASFVSNYLKMGDKIALSGSLGFYKDKNNRMAIKVKANEVETVYSEEEKKKATNNVEEKEEKSNDFKFEISELNYIDAEQFNNYSELQDLIENPFEEENKK